MELHLSIPYSLTALLEQQICASNQDADGTQSYLGNSDANFQTAKHGMMGYLFPIMADLVAG